MRVVTAELVKQDFDKFLIKYFHKTNPSYCIPNDTDAILWFYELPFDFQIGPVESYLRSVGIDIEMQHILNSDTYAGILPHHKPKIFRWGNTYEEAKIAALNEGFKIREQQLKALIDA